jgi:hypothetical protein
MSDKYPLELPASSRSRAIRGASELSEALGASRRPRRGGIGEVSIPLAAPKKRRGTEPKEAMFLVIMDPRKLRVLDVSTASKRVRDELVRRLGGAGTSSGLEPLSAAEEAVLREGGLDPDAPLSGGDPVARGQEDYERLLDTALSTEEAARFLGVNESRVRQRLNARPATLYGVRARRGWKLPRFQFTADDVVPGFEQVLAKVPRDIHPLELESWFQAPNADLPFREDAERALSPREWLCLGYPPGEVAALAEDL